MHDQDQDFDKQDNLDDQNRDEQTSDTSPHPPTGQSWASISQSLRKYNTWLDTALSLPQDGNGREPRRLFHNLAREHYTPIQSLRARYNSLRTPQPHPMSLVATLDVIHMPGLNTLQASEVISNYNIQRKHSNLTAIMKDSGSNVHLIPDNQVENIGIPALSILKPSKLSGIGTQQTLGTTDILFGIPTNAKKLHIYTMPDALILPTGTGPKCPLLSEILLEKAGYSWMSSTDICQLKTPDGLTSNLERDPITGFWFLLVKTTGITIDSARTALINLRTSSFAMTKDESTALQKLQPQNRDHVRIRIPRPPWHSLPQSIERMARRTHEALGHIHNKRIFQLANDNSVIGLEHLIGFHDPSDALTVCEGCILGKSKSKPTPKLTVKRPSHPKWGSMTIDTTGYITHESLQKTHYALIAVHSASINDNGTSADDGGTGFTIITGMALRSDSLMALQRIINSIQMPPIRIHSDNAAEYCSDTAKRFYAHLNINHTTSSPYAHHEVGKAERQIGVAKELARAMMLHAGCPPKLWQFALEQAVLISNYTSPPCNGAAATKWEAYYGTKPDLTNLFPFGCLAYIKITAEQQHARGINHSFGPRAISGIYLGQSTLNGESKHIVLSENSTLLATTSQNIYVNPDIYPYRPAAVIPSTIAQTNLATYRYNTFEISDPQAILSPNEYLHLFITAQRSLPTTRSLKQPTMASSSEHTIKHDTANKKKKQAEPWHEATIIGHSGPKTTRKYRIRWIGYGPEHDEWKTSRDITKDLLQEYYEKLANEAQTPPNPDMQKQVTLPRDVINGDYRDIDSFAESPDPRRQPPIIDPLDFSLAPLRDAFKQIIPYTGASYSQLIPVYTSKARQDSRPRIPNLINRKVFRSYDDTAHQIGSVKSFDEDTLTWHIEYPDHDYELVDSETLNYMLLDDSNATKEDHRQCLISYLLNKEITETKYNDEPKGQKQLLNHPEKDAILQSQQKEIQSFFDMGVFELVPMSSLPKGTNLLPSHVIYKRKYKINESTQEDEFTHWKARLVIGGNKQKDFTSSFAPTPSWSSIRLALAYACTKDWDVKSYDLASAFCRTPLEGQAIFVRPPPGLAPPGHCWQLHYAVYGLKDSNAQYNKLFTSQVLAYETNIDGKSIKFEQSDDDPCMFTLKDTSGQPILILIAYIDDLILASKNATLAKAFTTHLNKTWQVSEPETLNRYLGIHFTRLSCGGWSYSAKAYIQKAAKKYTRYPLHPHKTPLPTGYTVIINPDDPVPQDRIKHFQSILGTLLYCSTTVRLDATHAISTLAQYSTSPSEELVKMAYRVLAYLLATQDFSIKYTLPPNVTESYTLYGYCDAGFAGDPQTRRSSEGYVIIINGGAISWCSKRQPLVCLSTCEAELVSLVNAAKQMIFLNKILTFLGKPQSRLLLYEDNTSTISISKQQQSTSTGRTKHMDLRIKWIMELASSGLLAPLYVPTAFNVADIFTKSLPPETFNKLVRLILEPRSNPALSDQH